MTFGEAIRISVAALVVERAALQRVLRQAGIDDVCDVVTETAPGTSREEDRNDQTTAEGDPTAKQRDGGTEVTGDVQGSEQGKTGPSDALPGARISQDDEHRRRCRFWALNHLQPVVYSEFAKLNPEAMDDLDRILWRSILHGNNSLGFYDDFEDSEYSSALLPRDRRAVEPSQCRTSQPRVRTAMPVRLGRADHGPIPSPGRIAQLQRQ